MATRRATATLLVAVTLGAHALAPLRLRGSSANRKLEQELVLLGIEHTDQYDGDRNTIPDHDFVDVLLDKIDQTDGDLGPYSDLPTDDYIDEDAGYNGLDGVLGRTTGLLYGGNEQDQAGIDSVVYSELNDQDSTDAVAGYNPTVTHADRAAAAVKTFVASKEDGHDQQVRGVEDMDVFHPDAYGSDLPLVGRTSGLLPDEDGNLLALESMLAAPSDAEDAALFGQGHEHATLLAQVSKIAYIDPVYDLDTTDHLNEDAGYGDEDLGVLGRTTGLLYSGSEAGLAEEHKLIYSELEGQEMEGSAYTADLMAMMNYPVDAQNQEGTPEIDGPPLEDDP